MPDSTPRQIVSDKCIAFSEALISVRRSMHSDSEAVQIGHDLFTWFEGRDAMTDANAVIASRCVDLGIALLKSSIETTQSIVESVRESFVHYTS